MKVAAVVQSSCIFITDYYGNIKDKAAFQSDPYLSHSSYNFFHIGLSSFLIFRFFL